MRSRRESHNRLGHIRRCLSSRGEAHELGDVGVTEPTEARANDSFGPAGVDQQLRQRIRHVRFQVAEGGDEQHPHVGTRPHEVPDEEKRGGSAQCTSSSTSSTGACAPTAVSGRIAVCRRCRSVSASATSGAGRPPRCPRDRAASAASSAARRAELGSQQRRVASADQRVERLHERAVRRRTTASQAP